MMSFVKWAVVANILLLLPAIHGPTAFAKVKVNANPLTIDSVSIEKAGDRLEPGVNAQLVVKVSIAPGHHAYVDQFRLRIDSPQHVKVTTPKITPVSEFTDPVSKKVRQGVQGDASLSSVFELPEDLRAGPQPLKLILTYQACSKDYCLLPKDVEKTIEIQVAVQEHWWKRAAQNFDSQKSLDQALSTSWWAALALVFIAGVLTSFTPCIFPMIPITLTILGARGGQRSKRSRFFLSVCYVLGIAVTYSILGLVSALSGQLFGAFLGHPLVSGALFILFFAMALSMFGLFEVKPPQFLLQRFSLHKSQGGFVGAFMAGQLAGVLASPCVGPVLVSILAWVAKSQDWALGFAMLFTFAFGMGQLFLILGTFGQASWWPKSGVWMNGIKFILGISMLFLAFYYLKPALPLLTGEKGNSQQAASEQWRAYKEEEFQQALQSGRPVILDFWAEWCAACKEMESKTFADPQVAEVLKGYELFKFDATQTTEEFERLQEKYEIYGLPWTMFFDSQGQLLSELTLPGFEDPKEFLQRLEKVK